VELLQQQADAPAGFRHHLLAGFAETEHAMEQQRHVVARLQEHLAREVGRARLGKALDVAVEDAPEAVAAVQVTDHHAVDVHEFLAVPAKPLEVGADVRGRIAQRDQETGEMAVHLRHAEVVGSSVKAVELRAVHGQDGGARGVVETHHGGEVVRADIAKGQVGRGRHRSGISGMRIQIRYGWWPPIIACQPRVVAGGSRKRVLARRRGARARL
jgi:hypothetical protein